MKLNEVRHVSDKNLIADIRIKEKRFDSFVDSSIVNNVSSDHNLRYIPYCNLTGTLTVKFCNVRTYEGMPSKINGILTIEETTQKSKNLVGCPSEVIGDVNLNYLNLFSLKGLPRKIHGTLAIAYPAEEALKNIKDLWECEYDKISLHVYDTRSKLATAYKLIKRYKEEKNHNFIALMKEARELGLEDFFK